MFSLASWRCPPRLVARWSVWAILLAVFFPAVAACGGSKTNPTLRSACSDERSVHASFDSLSQHPPIEMIDGWLMRQPAIQRFNLDLGDPKADWRIQQYGQHLISDLSQYEQEINQYTFHEGVATLGGVNEKEETVAGDFNSLEQGNDPPCPT
jgi:hypothetical protein